MKFKKKNKKAQFYLIASIILIALFLGFVALINYSIKKDNPGMYKYVEELDLEGSKVLDYNLANGENQFDEFAKSYSYYVGGNKKIYFIVGEQGNLDSFIYEGEVRTDLSPNENGNEVTLEVEGNDFTFELEPGQNFYFVMEDESRGQEYFVTNTE